MGSPLHTWRVWAHLRYICLNRWKTFICNSSNIPFKFPENPFNQFELSVSLTTLYAVLNLSTIVTYGVCMVQLFPGFFLIMESYSSVRVALLITLTHGNDCSEMSTGSLQLYTATSTLYMCQSQLRTWDFLFLSTKKNWLGVVMKDEAFFF